MSVRINASGIVGEGPVSLLHRAVDGLVDACRPEMATLEERIDAFEKQVFDRPDAALVRRMLEEKRRVAALKRVVMPQRDVVGRLARREFVDVSTETSFRFRDVHDHLVAIAGDVEIVEQRLADMFTMLTMPAMSKRTLFS